MEGMEINNDWKRIVFLDIDSTISSDDFFNRTRGREGLIDPELVKMVNQLGEVGAEVVISSSWGYDNGRTEKTLREVGLTLPIIGYTEHFYQDWICRGNEIEKWLIDNFGGMGTRYGCDVNGQPYYRKHYDPKDVDYEYVIFDDDADFLLGQKDNFIRADRQTGLTQADIDKAKAILERKTSGE